MAFRKKEKREMLPSLKAHNFHQCWIQWDALHLKQNFTVKPCLMKSRASKLIRVPKYFLLENKTTDANGHESLEEVDKKFILSLQRRAKDEKRLQTDI